MEVLAAGDGEGELVNVPLYGRRLLASVSRWALEQLPAGHGQGLL